MNMLFILFIFTLFMFVLFTLCSAYIIYIYIINIFDLLLISFLLSFRLFYFSISAEGFDKFYLNFLFSAGTFGRGESSESFWSRFGPAKSADTLLFILLQHRNSRDFSVGFWVFLTWLEQNFEIPFLSVYAG